VLEQHIAHCVTKILNFALPDLSTSELQIGEIRLENSTSSTAQLDSLYSSLKLNKKPGGESIRLLTLLPGTSGAIQINMFCIQKLDDCPYQALSYTWGKSTVTRNITANGQEMCINQNLHDALSSLRLVDHSRTLWIDAVCINQRDDNEKTSQIAMMGAIYRHANNVLIFLGTPSTRSYLFFDFLERDPEGDTITEDNVGDIVNACRMDVVLLLSSFVEFCQREWWTRVWTMQEHFLSRGEPLWYIGSRYVHGSLLSRDLIPMGLRAIQMFSPAGQAENITLGVEGLTMGSFTTILKRLSGTIFTRLQPDFYISPRRLFTKLDREAQDSRDYVYGQLELLEPNFRHLFPPTYSMSPYSLFEKATSWLLLVDGWADLFWWYPRPVNSGAKSVSWVRDFTRRVQPESNELVLPSLSSLTNDNPKTVHCAIVGRVLHIRGIHLDTVQQVFRIPKANIFDVLRKVWQLDRLYCSDQFTAHFQPSKSPRNCILSWASSFSEMVPLAPRSMGFSQIIALESEAHVKHLSAKFATVPSYMVSIAGPAIIREMKSVGELVPFLNNGMEADFVSACVFDSENLISQLQDAKAAKYNPEEERRVPNLNESQTSDSGIVYQDLIKAIQICSEGAGNFKSLLSLVIKIASKIYESRNDPVSKFSPGTAVQKAIDRLIGFIEPRKKLIGELERDVERGCSQESATAQINEMKLRIDQLQREIDPVEENLQSVIKQKSSEGVAKTLHLDDNSWDRISNDFAALFRSREFFLTKSGILGFGSPGVCDIQVGDEVLLLDGLSCSLLARSHEQTKHTIVGCAILRGINVHDMHENTMSRDDVPTATKQIFMFI